METEAVNQSSLDDQWNEAFSETKNAQASQTQPQPQAARPPAEPPKPASFGALKQESTGALGNLDMILDIPVTISVEIGRTKLIVKDILQLGQGAVIELEKLVGEPMEVLVHGKLIARGEAVVVNDKFAVKLTDIVSPTERINNLR